MHAANPPAVTGPSSAPSPEPVVDVFDVPVTDCTLEDAAARIEALFQAKPRRAHAIYFVNTHGINLVCEDPSYGELLRRATFVFGDGTGVRWASRWLHGIRLRDNVNGTDLIPHIFATRAGRGYRYYLLGATPEAIEVAAEHAKKAFPGWELAGYHHGYVPLEGPSKLIERINASGADMLLVGMGNPKQELWIDKNLASLRVPACIGIGGLFDYWAGNTRAPTWLRKLGHEWLWILARQPHKFRRYVIGNPVFLGRLARRGGLRALARRV